MPALPYDPRSAANLMLDEAKRVEITITNLRNSEITLFHPRDVSESIRATARAGVF